MSQPIFFDGWDDLIRILVRAPLLYFAIIVFIRIAGKRSMAQMNNFDWMVTVALGSIVASGTLLKDVTLVETLFAISLFLLLQWGLTQATRHFRSAEKLIKAKPQLLVEHGRVLEDAMSRERITRDELDAAIRQSGLTDVNQVAYAVLETDATLSVIARQEDARSVTALHNVGSFSAGTNA